MMPLDVLVIFVPASFALNMAPGPNNILALSNGLNYGYMSGLCGALGHLTAFLIMMTVSAVGLGALLTASETAFQVVKWCGAAYLVYLGLKLLRSPAHMVDRDGATRRTPNHRLHLARHEFLVAMGNPKAILIFTAFFPQFLVPETPVVPQFAIMGITFLLLEAVAVLTYLAVGRNLSRVVSSSASLKWVNRLTGSALMAGGLLLAVARR